MDNPIYTIGHSNHSEEEFLDLLVQNDINAIADVRSYPYSEYVKWFNREVLAEQLKSKRIHYVFLGRELGGRGTLSERNNKGKVSYEKIAKTKSFKSGLERVCKGSEKYRIALMCSEGKPIDCHRAILIAKKLVEDGYKVIHILKDGDCENHYPDTENELLKLKGFINDDDSISDLENAYRKQEYKIAYEADIKF